MAIDVISLNMNTAMAIDVISLNMNTAMAIDVISLNIRILHLFPCSRIRSIRFEMYAAQSFSSIILRLRLR